MRYLYFFISFIICGLSLFGAPPPAPGGGVIERQIEKEYEGTPLEPEKKVPEIQVDIPEERLKMPSRKKITVCTVTLRGNRALSSQEILSTIQSDLNCPMSLDDIYALCTKIEALYAKKGFFLARAYPPPQTIENNTLLLEILEGTLGTIKVEGNKHYSTSFITKYFSRFLTHALNYDEFLRAIILLNENSDLQAAALFEKGSKVGTANLIIRVIDKYPVHLYLNGNDYGRYLTTNFRTGYRLDSQVLVDGDKFSWAEVVGFPLNALYFSDFVYRFPITHNGTFIELAYLNTYFHVEELKSLKLAGRSNIGTFKITHAAHRGRFMSNDLFLNFDYKQIQNFSHGATTSFDRIRLLTLAGTIDYYSERLGRHYTVGKIGCGIPNFLGGLGSPRPISSRPAASGKFFKFNLDYDFFKRLPLDTFFVFHASAQYSTNKLLIPEQIYIGGADTIRGFPLASALGDIGYYVNVEFRCPPYGLSDCTFWKSRKKWKEIFQWSWFFDQGGVAYHGGGSTYETATGFGLRIKDFWTFDFTAEVGIPLNHRDLSTDAFFYFKITGQPF